MNESVNVDTLRGKVWVPSLWMSSVWLLFLLFPILDIALEEDLAGGQKAGAVAALILFGIINLTGEACWGQLGGHHIHRGTAIRLGLQGVSAQVWFGLLLLMLAIATALGGIDALGATPFLISFAVTKFSWRTAGLITATTITFVVSTLWATDLFGELWFFVLIIMSVGAATGFLRLSLERSEDLSNLNTKLVLGEERNRVSRDVHDVLGHSLTAIVLKAQVADALLADADPEDPNVAAARAQITEMHDLSRQALTEIRGTVTGLRARGLVEEVAAAEAILADAGVALEVHGDASTLPDEVKPVLGWVVRESVTNIVRHADASSCSIELDADGAFLAVSDDGVGRRSSTEGNGLTGLRERLANNGLALEVDDHAGTKLSVVAAGAAL